MIGKASAIKPAKAREIAADYHARVRQGGDPAAEKHIQIQRASHTLGPLIERYLDQRKASLRPNSLASVTHQLAKNAKPLHHLPVDQIDLRAVAGLLAHIEKASGPVAANRCRAALSAMFSWAMREGLATSNPVINSNRREESPRDRVLTRDEIRLVWTNAAGTYGDIVRLLILTGQRREEVGGLRWDEINSGVISFPKERTKNHRAHEVPISPAVAAILSKRDKSTPFVFGRFSAWSRGKRELDKRVKIAPWVVHDLRRTVATGMIDIGVPPHVVEAVLNHFSGHRSGVAGIYNRSSYAGEKAEALAKWDRHLLSIVGGN